VHIITRKRLLEFGEKHPDAASALDHWYREAKHNDFASFADLRKFFPSADQVGRLVVFNIGGNKARLIAYIVYRKKRIYIRHVLTHKEYDKGKWKEEA
jgi:mRNA interferase HigB